MKRGYAAGKPRQCSLRSTAQLFNWRVIVVVALITAASVYVILTLGPAPSYRHLAQQVNEADDPIRVVGAPTGVAHTPGAKLELLEELPDELRIAVSGEGGLLVVRRAYHPLLRASIEGRSLPTLPVQLALLGIEVPPGEHTVKVDVPATPDRLAALGVLISLIACAALSFAPVPSNREAL